MAQGTLWPQPIQRALDSDGEPVAGAKATFYLAGTSTVTTVYSDVNLTIAHASPVVASGSGVFPEIYLTPGASYKVTMTTPGLVSLPGYPADNVGAVPTSGGNTELSGVAGEALTSGDVVYLSDGSNSLAAGKWYKADADATYSSTLPEIGIAIAAIISGAIGTIRLSGSVTGLSSLTTGTTYYVSGTAGALTATAPTNARIVGVADSTSSIVMQANPALTILVSPKINVSVVSNLFNGICGGRLTLTTAVPVTTADVTGATSIFFTPFRGKNIALYDGTAYWSVIGFSETTLALGTLTSGLPYDVFGYSNSGTLALESLAWTNGTTRATALATQDGVLVKTGVTTRRYLGTFFTTSTTQTEDSETKRYVWNYYNRVPRTLRKIDTTATWDYTLATLRQARADATNQVGVVIGVQEAPVHAEVRVKASNGAGAVWVKIGIGLDSTTVLSTVQVGGGSNTGGVAGGINEITSSVDVWTGVGQHLLVWLEWSAATNTTTWYGDDATTGTHSGIIGNVLG